MFNLFKTPTKVIIRKVDNEAFFILKDSSIEIFSMSDQVMTAGSSIIAINTGIELDTKIKYLDMDLKLCNKLENKFKEAYYNNLLRLHGVLSDAIHTNDLTNRELGVVINTNARLISPVNIYKFEKIGTITFPCKVNIIEKE